MGNQHLPRQQIFSAMAKVLWDFFILVCIKSHSIFEKRSRSNVSLALWIGVSSNDQQRRRRRQPGEEYSFRIETTFLSRIKTSWLHQVCIDPLQVNLLFDCVQWKGLGPSFHKSSIFFRSWPSNRVASFFLRTLHARHCTISIQKKKKKTSPSKCWIPLINNVRNLARSKRQIEKKSCFFFRKERKRIKNKVKSPPETISTTLLGYRHEANGQHFPAHDHRKQQNPWVFHGLVSISGGFGG